MPGCVVREVTLGRLVVYVRYGLGMGNVSRMLLSGNVIPDMIVVSRLPALMLTLLGWEW